VTVDGDVLDLVLHKDHYLPAGEQKLPEQNDFTHKSRKLLDLRVPSALYVPPTGFFKETENPNPQRAKRW
jgi:hypothetical protein